MEIDLEAIRKRDGDWRDDASTRERNLACRDRRALLQYIDDLTQIVEEIAADLGVIRSLHRERFTPKPPDFTPEQVEQYQQERRQTYQREYRKTLASPKKRKRENGASG